MLIGKVKTLKFFLKTIDNCEKRIKSKNNAHKYFKATEVFHSFETAIAASLAVICCLSSFSGYIFLILLLEC